MPPVSRAAYDAARSQYESVMGSYRVDRERRERQSSSQRATLRAGAAQPPAAARTSGAVQPGRLYLVQRKGPASFVIADDRRRSYTVTLGSRHRCTCAAGGGRCAHVRWVLTRCLQLGDAASMDGLTEQALAGAIERAADRPRTCAGAQGPQPSRGPSASAASRPPLHAETVAWLLSLSGEEAALLSQPEIEVGADGGRVPRRRLEDDEACAICMEPMFESDEAAASDARGVACGSADAAAHRLVWCAASCGRSVHAECLRVWALHRGGAPSCPLCRAAWLDERDVSRRDAEAAAAVAAAAKQRELRQGLEAVALREAFREVARRRDEVRDMIDDRAAPGAGAAITAAAGRAAAPSAAPTPGTLLVARPDQRQGLRPTLAPGQTPCQGGGIAAPSTASRGPGRLGGGGLPPRRSAAPLARQAFS